MAYFKQFARWPRKSLIIYAKHDLTFLPELSRNVVTEFERHGLDHKVVTLPVVTTPWARRHTNIWTVGS